MSQISFSDAEYAGKRKKIRREVFLDEMGVVVPRRVKTFDQVLCMPEGGLTFRPAGGRRRRRWCIEPRMVHPQHVSNALDAFAWCEA